MLLPVYTASGLDDILLPTHTGRHRLAFIVCLQCINPMHIARPFTTGSARTFFRFKFVVLNHSRKHYEKNRQY
jgi:hypothetical protein